MGVRQLTSDQAFALMRIASQNRNLKMTLVAEEIIETGNLDVPQKADRPENRAEDPKPDEAPRNTE